MSFAIAHTFLVHPAKSVHGPIKNSGSEVVDKEGKLNALLAKIFEASEDECKIDFIFNKSSDGEAKNDSRSAILSYLYDPNQKKAGIIAERLSRVTTKRSGLGLMFSIVGQNEKGENKLIISRFPADHGLLAEERKSKLSVQFIDQVFLKNSFSYKSALFSGNSQSKGFWEGRAVDRQAQDRDSGISKYWINEFLDADFATTSAAGSRRLGMALRASINETEDDSVREELIALSLMLKNFDRKKISIDSILQQFSVSESAAALIESQLPSVESKGHIFELSVPVYMDQIKLMTVRLDSGAILTAESEKFSSVFKREKLGDRDRFVAEGIVVSENVKKGSKNAS